MTLPPKICPMCKQRNIASWESTCAFCWAKIITHDICPMCMGKGGIHQENINGGFTTGLCCPKCGGSGFTGVWRINMIIFNNFREFCRSCGFDPIVEIRY